MLVNGWGWGKIREILIVTEVNDCKKKKKKNNKKKNKKKQPNIDWIIELIECIYRTKNNKQNCSREYNFYVYGIAETILLTIKESRK